MRKLGSRRKEEKKQKRKQLIVGVVLASILFVSIFGYSFGRGGNAKKNKIIYNGYEFVEQNGFWFTEIGNFEFSFRYNPNEIKQIDSDLNFLESYYEKPLYISSDDIESESEIYRNLMYQNSIIQRMQLACLEGEECANDELPIKTCDDNFIIIRESDVTEVVQEDNCVFIRGEAEELAKITDAFLLKIIGVQ
ncbi:hypothetical protein KAT24_01745 [Candidatus Pacearchaeota archaeon]|nr:hypothetical protein [Candidatus Pacearchaeota archaeon]